ncbi:hypothetical protein [Nocardia pseudobrasiliensis]|uniref:Uncharacterized protein n=1 Tax=Nocardia pseudobrasiliensis TaxID=45979 RepID=A0A370IC46_9NOCA|nr:hypothetical protein [Nocardia pseudobrasiliensis]RDI68180.1 hypothetical protein DFR76_102581 [Nocardia pseudobrasiliensis]
MSITTSGPESTHRAADRLPRWVTVSAWLVPVLIIGQFAMVAIVPVLATLIGTLRGTRRGALRWAAVALAVAYAIPLIRWATEADPAPSLSKDMHPVLAAVIVVVSLGYQLVRLRRRG